MSQTQDILSHLETGQPITPIEALTKFGCFRLGARIYDLRCDGYPIQTNTLTVRGKSFAQYTLQKRKRKT